MVASWRRSLNSGEGELVAIDGEENRQVKSNQRKSASAQRRHHVSATGAGRSRANYERTYHRAGGRLLLRSRNIKRHGKWPKMKASIANGIAQMNDEWRRKL
jgi:hypothetical protein